MQAAVTAEISAPAIVANLRAIRRRTNGRIPICPAVKADSYGHGTHLLVDVLRREGVERLAVAHLEEALRLRELGWERPILCLGAPLLAGGEEDVSERVRAVVAGGIHCTIASVREAELVGAEARRANRPGLVEVKVDSGMGRMGLLPDAAATVVHEIAAVSGVSIEGVYTHFATADEHDVTFAREQLAAFLALVRRLRAASVPVRAFHAANSAAIFRLADAHLDMVRPGLALYGYWGGDLSERPADLVPAMRVVSRLVAVRRLPAEHGVGYGRTYRTGRESLIGVVPIGYGDGYRRSLSNNAVMTLDAERGRPRQTVPVVGRVSMDQVTLDVTNVPDVRIGDRVIIIDNDPAAPNSTENMARVLGTIPYEITCLIGRRVTRVLT